MAEIYGFVSSFVFKKVKMSDIRKQTNIKVFY